MKGARVSLRGNTFSFDIPEAQGHYNGKVSIDSESIFGHWTQGSQSAEVFDLRRLTSYKPSFVDGNWTGVLQTTDGPLPVVVRIHSDRTDREHVTLDSPGQCVTFVEASNVAITGSAFNFSIDEWHATYVGKINNDGVTIDGTWNQDGVLPLHLIKSTSHTEGAEPRPSMRAPGCWTTAKKEPPLGLTELKNRLDDELSLL